MDCWSTWLLLVSLLAALLLTGGVELTFELADSAKECFYQEIGKNVSSTLEFQVRFALSLSFLNATQGRFFLTTRHDASPVARQFRDAILYTRLRGRNTNLLVSVTLFCTFLTFIIKQIYTFIY